MSRLCYEVDPLCCPQCGGQMKVVALLEPRAPERSDGRGDVIEEILRHCGLWQASAPRAPPDIDGLANRVGCRLLGQLYWFLRTSRPVPGTDVHRHRHVPGQLLIIPDAHRHRPDAYELRDRPVFCPQGVSTSPRTARASDLLWRPRPP